AERIKLFEVWGKEADRHGLVNVAHVGCNSLPDAQELVRAAEATGAAAISAMAPTFFKPTDEAALCAWFVEMTRPAPALPFYFYDIPPMTGVTVDTAAFMLLAKERLQGFVGIKFTNQDLDLLARCMNHESVKADILFGTDERLIEGLALGCAGGVGSTYNFAAPLYRRIIDAYNRGDMEAAQADQARSVKMIERMFQSGFGGACKAVMGFAGVDCGPVRPPINRLQPEAEASLRADLDAMGFFDWALK
ncbi:MAG: dihydrodipicolinate synthase family protein, partial [Limisphaerales bacterium]